MAGYDGRAAKFPLIIVDGADLAFQLTVVDGNAAAVDLSAATIAGELYNAAGTVVDTLSAVVSGAGNNIVTLSLTDTETAALVGVDRWTLWVTRGGDRRPWFAGSARVVDGRDGATTATSGTTTVTVDSDLSVTVNVAAIGGSGGGASTLDDLTDVTITTATNGNVLSYNGAAWVNSTPAGGGDLLAANNLSDLTNAGTARTNLGLGSAATSATSAFDAAGAAAAAQAASQPVDADLTTIAAANNGTVLAATTASFTTADESKLDGIEADADVTDTVNVTAAGALMDSEVTNLAAVKAFDPTDYATAAQGSTADSALQPTAIATVTGTTDTLAGGDDQTFIQYTAAGAVTVTLADIATGFEAVLVCLGAGGLSVAAGGMSYANGFTPKLTVAQGEALYVRQTAASTWAVIGGTAT